MENTPKSRIQQLRRKLGDIDYQGLRIMLTREVIIGHEPSVDMAGKYEATFSYIRMDHGDEEYRQFYSTSSGFETPELAEQAGRDLIANAKEYAGIPQVQRRFPRYIRILFGFESPESWEQSLRIIRHPRNGVRVWMSQVA
jgi:hypothetical protein